MSVDVPVRPHVVIRPALVSLNNLARSTQAFLDNNWETAYSDEEKREYLQAWRRAGRWLGELPDPNEG
jgi:hypothetical protein